MSRFVATQIVVAQLAVALVIAGVAAGIAWAVPAVIVAVLLLVLATGRLRRQWLFEWIGHGRRYLSRRRSLPPGSSPSALLDLLRPGATVTSIDVDGSSIGVVRDAYGLTAVIEVGDTSGLLGEAPAPVPALA